jgi:hypothetical protein
MGASFEGWSHVSLDSLTQSYLIDYYSAWIEAECQDRKIDRSFRPWE